MSTAEHVVVVGETGEILEGLPAALPALRVGAAPALIRAERPAEFVERATEVATVLADVIERQNLYTVIQGRKHVLIEGWATLGSLMGTFGQAVFAVTEWTRPVVDANGERVGWEARARAQTMEGAIVGGAEAECLRTESNWRSSDDYALKSMAQTRAASKALRMPLGFVMQLAGYSTTPGEEMPSGETRARKPKAATAKDTARLRELLVDEGHTDDVIDKNFERRKVEGVLPAEYVKKEIGDAETRLAQREAAATASDPDAEAIPF